MELVDLEERALRWIGYPTPAVPPDAGKQTNLEVIRAVDFAVLLIEGQGLFSKEQESFCPLGEIVLMLQ